MTDRRIVTAPFIPQENATVLAFDPGGHTGWCALSVKPETLWTGDAEVNWESPVNTVPLHHALIHIDYGEINCGVGGEGWINSTGRGHDGLNMAGENRGIDAMLKLAAYRFKEAAIVFEDFILDDERNEKGRDLLSPVRITAGFSYGFSDLGKRSSTTFESTDRIFIQNRSDPKTTCSDARLRQFKLYDESSGRHARDAMRHAYFFLRRCRGGSLKARELRWRAWPHLFGDPNFQAGLTGRTPQKKPRQKKVGERITFLS